MVDTPSDTDWASSFAKFYNNSLMSDVILKVIAENETYEEFYAHKVILGLLQSLRC